MDENTRKLRRPPVARRLSRAASASPTVYAAVDADGHASASGLPQPALPLDVALPFDDESHDPIPFALTARARRKVAPEQVPDLRVVPGDDGGLDRAGDPRPAQARALRRSGLAPEIIADQLNVDELVIRAWIADTAPAISRRRVIAARPVDGREFPVSGGGPKPQELQRPDPGQVAKAPTRADAHGDALHRLATDASFAATVGLLAGLVSVQPAALSCTTSQSATAAKLLECLRREHPVPDEHVRVVLRIGVGVAGDLARHRWSRVLDLPAERVVHTRWSAAPRSDAVEAMIRIIDDEVAATVAGWLDAFFDPAALSLDLAF